MTDQEEAERWAQLRRITEFLRGEGLSSERILRYRPKILALLKEGGTIRSAQQTIKRHEREHRRER